MLRIALGGRRTGRVVANCQTTVAVLGHINTIPKGLRAYRYLKEEYLPIGVLTNTLAGCQFKFTVRMLITAAPRLTPSCNSSEFQSLSQSLEFEHVQLFGE